MKITPCTPLEITTVLELHPDYDSAVQCLEFIRLHFSDLFPKYQGLNLQLMALCHHSPNNIYPALSVIGEGTESIDNLFNYVDQITETVDQWVTEISLTRLVEMSKQVLAPSWSEVMAMPNPSVKGTSCGKPQSAPYVER